MSIQITTASFLRGDFIIFVDNQYEAVRAFRKAFSSIPQSLPQCTPGFYYLCGGDTWRMIPQGDLNKMPHEIIPATKVWEKLKNS